MWWTPCVWSFRNARSYALPLHQARLVLAPREAAPRNELDACLDDEHLADPLTDPIRERVLARAISRDLDADGQRRLLLHARAPRPDDDVAADRRRELPDDLADGGREDVDAANDEHVVRPAEAADARRRPSARAHARAQADVVARAEAEERSGLMAQVREHELAGRAIRELDRVACLRVDQLDVDEPARAEMHPDLLLAFTPERDADVADAHRLRHLRAPALLQLSAKRGLSAAGLARDQNALDLRVGEVDDPLPCPLQQVLRV